MFQFIHHIFLKKKEKKIKLKPTPRKKKEKERELHNKYVSCGWFIPFPLAPQYVSEFTGNGGWPVHSHMFLCVVGCSALPEEAPDARIQLSTWAMILQALSCPATTIPLPSHKIHRKHLKIYFGLCLLKHTMVW